MPRMLFILAALWLVVPLSAQEGSGQVCLRAFEDRNVNGSYDANEPFITRDISATLADVDGVIVASALLDDSPRAALGLLCFQNLAAGQYTLTALSATYAPTALFAFVTSVSADGVPQIFDYGAQVIVSPPPKLEGTPTLNVRALLPRLFFSLLGTLLLMSGMIVVGALIFFLFVRPKPAPTAYAAPTLRPDTGSYTPYRAPNPPRDDLSPADDDTGKQRLT